MNIDLKRTLCADPMDGVGIVYTVEQDDWEALKEESYPQVQQRLLLFLFLQNSDPFTLRLSDRMGESRAEENFIFSVRCLMIFPSL